MFFLLRRALGTDRIVTPETTTVTPSHLTEEATQINSALDFFFRYLFTKTFNTITGEEGLRTQSSH